MTETAANEDLGRRYPLDRLAHNYQTLRGHAGSGLPLFGAVQG